MEIPPSGTSLRQLRELEKTGGGVAALVTGPYAPHPCRLLAESPFTIELIHMDGQALQHLQVIYPAKNTYPVEKPPAREVDQRVELHGEPRSKVQMEGHEEKGVRGWASSPYLELFQNRDCQVGAADAEWPRLGQADRTDPMPAMKRSRNAPNPKRGARSGITANAARVPPEDLEIPEQGWTVSTCPPFMIYNKKHLSKDCAAGIVTNGAGVVPGIYLLDRTPIAVTRSEGSQVQLYWPFHINETCQSVLVSPTAFGATSPPDPKDLKSPWQQPLHVSWAAELTRKLLACEQQHGRGSSLTIATAKGRLCPMPQQLRYDELYLTLQEVQAAREDFPLLITVDKRSPQTRLPSPDILRAPFKRRGDICNLHRLIMSHRAELGTAQREETSSQ